METKIIFIGELKKLVPRDPYATIYGTKLWKTLQVLISIVATKFRPVLKFEPDVISNISKLSTKYGIYIKDSHDSTYDYYYIVKQILISIATCVKYNQSTAEIQIKYFILPCLDKLLCDIGIEEFDDDEEKEILKIEKSLSRFIKKFRKKYTVEIKILDKKDDDSEVEEQLSFDDLVDDVPFVKGRDPEKNIKIKLEYEGILLTLSLTSGIPSLFFIDDVEEKYFLDPYSQMMVENDVNRFKNRNLVLRIKKDLDPSGKTVAIIE